MGSFASKNVKNQKQSSLHGHGHSHNHNHTHSENKHNATPSRHNSHSNEFDNHTIGTCVVELFKRYDKDNSNSIDKKELHKLLKELQIDIKKKKLDLYISKYSTDRGSKELFYEEFCRLYNDIITARHAQCLIFLTKYRVYNFFTLYNLAI